LLNWSGTFSAITGPDISELHSQKPATGSYLVPIESSSHQTPILEFHFNNIPPFMIVFPKWSFAFGFILEVFMNFISVPFLMSFSFHS
jgi:hypothetical protein